MRENLNCIATGHGDRWEAFCLDLDLAVQGSSFDEVRRSLDKAIHMHIEGAMQEPEPTRTQLLNRKAPVLVRLLWRVRLWSRLLRTVERDNTIRFSVACHA